MEVGSRNKVKFAFRARNFQHRLKPVISYIRDLILWEQTLQPDILGLSVTAAAWVRIARSFGPGCLILDITKISILHSFQIWDTFSFLIL